MLKNTTNQSEFPDFYLHFGGKLNTKNRWVKLAEIIPWELVEECYRESLAESGMGAPAISSRIAYGALIIKEKKTITDAETVSEIFESPYLQHFLGYKELLKDPPFDESMMVYFRSRFTQEHHRKINEFIVAQAQTSNDSDQDPPAEPPTHSGKLLVDATCTPADIRFPTDIGLLNEAREKTEKIIDEFHKEICSRQSDINNRPKKPRTYRQEARKNYLDIAKSKRPGKKKIRKAIRQQLQYLKRNLGHIDRMLTEHEGLIFVLKPYRQDTLETIRKVHLQQQQMYTEKSHRVEDRIVSISQPYVRPIVRGKVAKKVEFGAKISISHHGKGYVTLDRISWDAYNEKEDLIPQIEAYKERYGFYPESVHADKIYRTRENRKYCKDKSIRMSGAALGRPKKVTEENKEQLAKEKQEANQSERDRIPVEGKFGNAKRKGTLERIMAKLKHTSESVIHVGILVLNLDKRLKELLLWLVLSHIEKVRLEKIPA